MEEQKEKPIDKPREQKFSLNKRLLIIAGSILAVLLLFVSIVLLQGTSNEGISSANPTLTPEQNASNSPQSSKRVPNPLINPAEIDKVESAIRKKMGESGVTISPKPEYEFQYELAPDLQGKNPFPFINLAYGANSCNITSAPSTVPVYTLEAHMNIVDAKAIASEYNISGEPSGISLPDGSFSRRSQINSLNFSAA